MRDQIEEDKQDKEALIYIKMVMEQILNNNIFSFHDSNWKQDIGATMGSIPLPSYEDISYGKSD